MTMMMQWVESPTHSTARVFAYTLILFSNPEQPQCHDSLQQQPGQSLEDVQ